MRSYGRNAITITLLLLSLLALTYPSPAAAQKLEPWSGKVVGISDGDTITAMHEGRGEKIRLYGIDCPERGQDFSAKAKQFMSDLVFGKVVKVAPEDQDLLGTSVFVFQHMREDALDKMLNLQEVLVVQHLVTGTSAAQNLVHARFQESEESLYSSLGINMAFLKQVYDKRGRLPEKTIAMVINDVSRYRRVSELSRDEKFNHVFKQDVIEFMDKVEKSQEEAIR